MTSTAFLSQALPLVQSMTAMQFFAIAIAATVIYNVLLVIYRLTLHPLAHFPGRFIDKVSVWPLVLQCYSGGRHLELLEAHKKYGPIVRIAPNMLDFDTAAAQQAVHRDRSTNVRKSDWYKCEPCFTGATSVQTVIDKTEHDFRRRVLQPAFSDIALREQEKFISNNVHIFLSKLAKDTQHDGWSSPKDFSIWVTYWGFDFISDLAFGSRFALLDDPMHRYLPDMLKWASRFIYFVGYLPFQPLVHAVLKSPYLMSLIPGVGGDDGYKFFAAGETKMEERKAMEELGMAGEKSGRKDIFHYLFQSRDPVTGRGFTHEELMADSGLLIGAGSDAVSVTVAAAVFYLLSNPNTMDKLLHEVRGSFSTLDDIRGPKLQQLAYLTGVVNEALRLAPAVPSGLPRKVLPGGLQVDGVHIPAGTNVSVSPYAVHHNEDCFPESFAFRPERWMESRENATEARRALCTFSAGRFDCVGKNIAVLACKLVLAKLFFAYDVRAAGGLVTGGGGPTVGKGRGRTDEFQLLDYVVSYRSGPMVEMKERIVVA